MKASTYTHKSGNYIARYFSIHSRRIQHASGYTITDLLTNQTTRVRADLIENSSDWTPMTTVPLNEYFTQDEIIVAFRNFLSGVRVLGQPVEEKTKTWFEKVFFLNLEDQRK